MNAPLQPHWSAARWCAVAGAAFAAQAGLVFLLSGNPVPAGRGAAAETPRFRMALIPVPPGAGTAEPASLAMSGRHDFSRTAWLSRSNLTHRLSDWTEGAEWWRYPTNRLTRDFQALVDASGISRPATRELPQQPAPVPEEDNTELALLRSSVELGGTLAAIGLRQPLAVPEIISPDVLPPTRVQVSVNKDGLVLSALVTQGSGNAGADAAALRLAAGAQFRPPAAAVSLPGVGAMTFRWATIPPRTNAVPAP
jgi:TonB family protein